MGRRSSFGSVVNRSLKAMAREADRAARAAAREQKARMQIISLDFVDWLKNETMETYLDNIPKWIKYLKEIKAEREKYGI